MNQLRDKPVVVIGAGPAGLACGAALRERGIEPLMLEKDAQPGSNWRRHYDRLHLHTARDHSELPGMHFPPGTPRYPSREQVVDYLDRYAEKFELDITTGAHVEHVGLQSGRWLVSARDGREWMTPNVVFATGYNNIPRRANWPGTPQFDGPIMHSREYRNGAGFRDRKVLVVGFGNSGGEIAIDLVEHGAEVGLAVRSPVNVVPREIFGIPVATLGIHFGRLPPRISDLLTGPLIRRLVGRLDDYGLQQADYGVSWQVRRRRRIPLIDVGTLEHIRAGNIRVFPGIERFEENDIVFSDGSREHFDAVVMATGYRPGLGKLLGRNHPEIDVDGVPLHSGERSGMAGLFFCGFRVVPTGMLREVGLEAQRIATMIAGGSRN